MAQCLRPGSRFQTKVHGTSECLRPDSNFEDYTSGYIKFRVHWISECMQPEALFSDLGTLTIAMSATRCFVFRSRYMKIENVCGQITGLGLVRRNIGINPNISTWTLIVPSCKHNQHYVIIVHLTHLGSSKGGPTWPTEHMNQQICPKKGGPVSIVTWMSVSRSMSIS